MAALSLSPLSSGAGDDAAAPNTALFAACQRGELDLAMAALRNGADPNHSGDDGQIGTPLAHAAMIGHKDLCMALIRFGATNPAGADGLAEDWALAGGFIALSELLRFALAEAAATRSDKAHASRRMHEVAIAERKAKVHRLEEERQRRHLGQRLAQQTSKVFDAQLERAAASAEAAARRVAKEERLESILARKREKQQAQADKFRQQLERTVQRHEMERGVEARRRQGVELSRRRTYEEIERRRLHAQALSMEKESPWEQRTDAPPPPLLHGGGGGGGGGQQGSTTRARREEEGSAPERQQQLELSRRRQGVAERLQKREAAKAVAKARDSARPRRVARTSSETIGGDTSSSFQELGENFSLLARIGALNPNHSFVSNIRRVQSESILTERLLQGSCRERADMLIKEVEKRDPSLRRRSREML